MNTDKVKKRKVSNSSSDNGRNNNTRNDEIDNKKTNKRKKSNIIFNVFVTLFYITVIILVAIISFVMYFLTTRLGFGKINNNSKYENMNPIYDDDVLEIVCELDIPPGNIAVNRDYRTFFNYHPEYNPNPIKIVEMVNFNSSSNTYDLIPYPSLEYQSNFITILSLRIDGNNILWLLDFAQHGLLGSPKLYGFQLFDSFEFKKKNDFLKYNYTFPSGVAGIGSFLNDFQVDTTGDFIYIADTSIIASTPALIIFSVKKFTSYRLLSNHPSMFGESLFWNISGTKIPKIGPFGIRIHIDSIALDRDGSVLYFGAVTSNKLYGISTSYLLTYVDNADYKKSDYVQLLENELPYGIKEVDLYDENDNIIGKPCTDGLSTDNAGNIFLTSFEQSSISIAMPMKSTDLGKLSMRLKKVVESKDLLRWPDGFSFGPDGLYITTSALNLKMANMLGGPKHMEQFRPFHILRLPLDKLEIFQKVLDDGTVKKFAQSGR